LSAARESGDPPLPGYFGHDGSDATQVDFFDQLADEDRVGDALVWRYSLAGYS
jgi:hypothetical protein